MYYGGLGGTAGFNSRSREGSDVCPDGDRTYQTGFNSRSREGSDVLGEFRRQDADLFQFTLP